MLPWLMGRAFGVNGSFGFIESFDSNETRTVDDERRPLSASSPPRQQNSGSTSSASDLYGSVFDSSSTVPDISDIEPQFSRAEEEEGGGDEEEEAEHVVEEDSPNEIITDITPEEEDSFGLLTRRLRFLFAIITWPIIPLGTIVTVAFFWLLYAAFGSNLGQSCAHPLRGYAVLSLILIAYIPNHARIRSFLFNYVRERDGHQRPAHVRRYDQCFQTLALIYVYCGMTLVQTCREDLPDFSSATSSTGDKRALVNSCAATCPDLYRAMWVYVSTVELFTFSVILPFLFLPCVYVWFLRQATVDADALAALQERLREEEFFLRNGGVTAQDILDKLERVQLVQVCSRENDATPAMTTLTRLFVVPTDNIDFSSAKDANGVKNCCICMADFSIRKVVQTNFPDLETGHVLPQVNADDDHDYGGTALQLANAPMDSTPDEEAIVRIPKCGHLFHEHCITSWIGGRWQSSETNHENASPSRRRARRTTCPLCRSDLRPS